MKMVIDIRMSLMMLTLAITLSSEAVLVERCQAAINGEQAINPIGWQDTHFQYQVVPDPAVNSYHITFTMTVNGTGSRYFAVEYNSSFDEDSLTSCDPSESSTCVISYTMPASDLSDGQLPNSASVNNNIRIVSQYATICYLDVLERKAGVDIEIDSRWRKGDGYTSLIVDVTEGFPAPISFSDLTCNEQLLNSTQVNDGEFQVPNSLYIGKDLFLCTIRATNKQQNIIISVPRFPLIQVTTTPSTTVAVMDTSGYVKNEILIGIVAGLFILFIFGIAVTVFFMRKKRSSFANDDRHIFPRENPVEPTNITIVNGIGLTHHETDGMDNIIPDHAPSLSRGPPSLDSQCSGGSSGIGSHHSGSDLSQDGSQEPPPAPRLETSISVPENTENNISKRYENSDQLNITDTNGLLLSSPDWQPSLIAQPEEERTASNNVNEEQAPQTTCEGDAEKQVGDLDEHV